MKRAANIYVIGKIHIFIGIISHSERILSNIEKTNSTVNIKSIHQIHDLNK